MRWREASNLQEYTFKRQIKEKGIGAVADKLCFSNASWLMLYVHITILLHCLYPWHLENVSKHRYDG